MKEIQIINNSNRNKDFDKKSGFISSTFIFIFKKSHSILIIINLILTTYLLKQNNKLYPLNTEFNLHKDNFKNENIKIDKDMIGLEYPEINFQSLKNKSINGKIISSFLELLTTLEIKLLYLEKEINCTKLIQKL